MYGLNIGTKLQDISAGKEGVIFKVIKVYDDKVTVQKTKSKLKFNMEKSNLNLWIDKGLMKVL